MPTGIPNRRKAQKSRGRSPKKARSFKTRLPLGEIIAIRKMWVEGVGNEASITAIAAKFNRSWDTIAKIVQAPEMRDYALSMERQLLQELSDKVVERLVYAVGNKKTKDGNRIALELAEKWGAIPGSVHRLQLQKGPMASQEYAAKPEPERLKDWVADLTAMTLERGEAFGMDLPELAMLEDEKTINVPAGRKGKS